MIIRSEKRLYKEDQMDDKTYTFTLKYDPEKDRLFNSFSVMANILEAQEKSSNLILSVIDPDIIALQQLDFIQKGSLQVRILDALKSLKDDEIRKNGWVYIGRELIIIAKNALIEYIENREEINNKRDIENIKDAIVENAKPVLPPDQTLLLESAGKGLVSSYIETSMEPYKKLSPTQELFYANPTGKIIKVNKKCSFNMSSIEEELSFVEIIENIELILLVKKPDYIGESQWDFQMVSGGNSYPLQGKILNEDWLKSFQNSSLSYTDMPLPKDALRVIADLKITKKSENDKNPKVTCQIHQVLEVLKGYAKDETLCKASDFLQLMDSKND